MINDDDAVVFSPPAALQLSPALSFPAHSLSSSFPRQSILPSFVFSISLIFQARIHFYFFAELDEY